MQINKILIIAFLLAVSVSLNYATFADDWQNYSFENVTITIDRPINQETIPFQKYTLFFTVNHTRNGTQNITCRFYVRYVFDFNTPTQVYTKQYTTNTTPVQLTAPMTTTYSFIDDSGAYNKDNPRQQIITVACGLESSKEAGKVDVNYYVAYPSNITLLFLFYAFMFIVIGLVAALYTENGVAVCILSSIFIIFATTSMSVDGILNAWIFRDIILFMYIINSGVFAFGLYNEVFKVEKEYEVLL